MSDQKSIVPEQATKLDYNAVKPKNRRQAPRTNVTAEHVQLPASKRRTLMATAQDQQRNLSLLAWMVRMHLDYVSSFKMTFRSGNEGLDRLIDRIFHWHAQPENFDVAGRLGREEGFRLFEAEKTVNGDALFIKIDSMKKLQAIESDMIAYPKDGWYRKNRVNPLPKKVSEGVHKNDGVILSSKYPGRIEEFCICNRGDNGKKVMYDHLEKRENCIFDGYFTRFSSQVRGVSPLSSALTSIQDVCEAVEWNMLKAKAHAIFGLAIMREYYGTDSAEQENGSWGEAAGTGEELNTAGDPALEQSVTQNISSSLQDMNPDQMMILDMDTKGKVDVIESSTPSNEFQDFVSLMARLILLSLDIPYSMYDSRGTTFAGRIADTQLYERSTRNPREKNKWKRIEYSNWLLDVIWNDTNDEWDLKGVARSAGITRLRDLQDKIKWVPYGIPWLQKLNEIQGDIRAIEAGLDNPIDICARRGVDYFENIDKTSEANKYAKSKNVSIFIGSPGARTVEETEKAEDTPMDDNTEDSNNE
jgi:capsid protein